MLRTLLLPILVAALLSGCQDPRKETTSNSSVTIQVGEQGQNFTKRYPDKLKVDQQPAGLDFYRIGWKNSNKGVATIEHEKHSFSLGDVIGVVGTQNNDFPTEGVSEWNITVGITGPNGLHHDDARKKMFSILQQILKAG